MTRITGKTVDPAADQDVITFRIGATEVGRLTSASTLSVGSSYLIASQAASGSYAQSTPANARWVIQDPHDTTVGSDVAIDGSDSSKINIRTTGLYSITGMVALSISAGASADGWYEVDLNVSDTIWFATFNATAVENNNDGGFNRAFAFSWPLAAGDVLTVAAQVASAPSGQWWSTGEAASLQIVRLA